MHLIKLKIMAEINVNNALELEKKSVMLINKYHQSIDGKAQPYYLVHYKFIGDYTKPFVIALCSVVHHNEDLIVQKINYTAFVKCGIAQAYGLDVPVNEYTTWNKIHNLEDVGILEREYTLDFVEYHNAQWTIYIKAWKFSCA